MSYMVEHRAKEVVEMLKAAGYIESYVNGDHHIFKKPGRRSIPVPYSHLKDAIRIGTYQSIIRSIQEVN